MIERRHIDVYYVDISPIGNGITREDEIPDLLYLLSSVIRQKGEGVSKKQSTPNFPKNEHF